MLMSRTPLYLVQDIHPQAQACRACAVRRDALFGALDDHEIETIHTHIESPAIDADQLLYAAGRSGATVYTIRAGVVRFERTTEQGQRRIVRLAGRGELIGQEALLMQPYSEDAIAATGVELCRIPVGMVTQFQIRPPVTQELMRRWQAALVDARSWSVEITTGSARSRLVHLLLRLHALADHEGRAWLPRREEIADMVDLRTETVSRWISQWRREGVIDTLPPRHGRIDAVKLRAALRETDG